MKQYDKDFYCVAVKVFLREGNKLLIIHDIFGQWDLPGGRIKTDEFDTPLELIIERKMKEELGEAVKYSKPKQNGVFFRVERLEQGLNRKVRIFAIGYEAEYKGGEITLGKHMNDYKWVDLDNFNPDEYLKGGWLKGVKDYLELLPR
jgi:ADP-ribose pyrophosphatase YjhB (NUDIX family)